MQVGCASNASLDAITTFCHPGKHKQRRHGSWSWCFELTGCGQLNFECVRSLHRVQISGVSELSWCKYWGTVSWPPLGTLPKQADEPDRPLAGDTACRPPRRPGTTVKAYTLLGHAHMQWLQRVQRLVAAVKAPNVSLHQLAAAEALHCVCSGSHSSQSAHLKPDISPVGAFLCSQDPRPQHPAFCWPTATRMLWSSSGGQTAQLRAYLLLVPVSVANSPSSTVGWSMPFA